MNNYYEGWGMYAIGGSAKPTINSEGNRFIAPNGGNMKEVRTNTYLTLQELQYDRLSYRPQVDGGSVGNK